MPTGLIGQLALQAGSQAIGAGMGLALQKQQDRRQLRQQDKLLYQQQGYNKEMTEFNRMQQMKMWEDTNYSAQMEQLRKAGLNPGLLYGMGGGGGQSSNINTGQVGGAHAPVGGGEVGMGMQLGLQTAMQAAQIENLKANTKKTNVEADKTAGVDTELTKTQTASLSQGIKNEQIRESILKWEDNLKRIESNIAEQTSGDRMGMIVSLADQAAIMSEMMIRDNDIAQETKQSKIDEIKARSIGAIIQNDATAQSILQKWKELELKGQEINIKAFEAQLKAEYPGVFNVVGGAINGVIRILSGNKKFNSSEDPRKQQ